MSKRKALGRGISSLIPKAPERTAPQPTQSAAAASSAVSIDVRSDVASDTGILLVPVDRIRLNPFQPRKVFDADKITALKDSIQMHGLLSPLVVTQEGSQWELVSGERRLRACKELGIEAVPCTVKTLKDRGKMEIALVENLQREDLNPLEEARGYERLSKEFDLTQEDIAKRCGKQRSTVTNLMRLLKLPHSVQKLVSGGDLTMGHARALLALGTNALTIEHWAKKTIDEGLSVRVLENKLRSLGQDQLPAKKKTSKPVELDANVRSCVDRMQRQLGTKVEIKASAPGKGELRIRYFSQEDLTRISNAILNP